MSTLALALPFLDDTSYITTATLHPPASQCVFSNKPCQTGGISLLPSCLLSTKLGSLLLLLLRTWREFANGLCCLAGLSFVSTTTTNNINEIAAAAAD